MDLHAAAIAWHEAGCAVVPVRADGTKTPAVPWKPFQATRPTRTLLDTWFTGQSSRGDLGIGVICGMVSGNLELLEVEARAVGDTLARYAALLRDHDLGPVWDRLNAGYFEQSPSGGLHWLYRVDGQPRRNLKLARRPATPDELAARPMDKIKVLLETRGEGGFVVVAPSDGLVHESGRPWVALVGGPADIPVLSVDERDGLHAVARLLDQMPTQQTSAPLVPARHHQTDPPDSGDRPGDDFNARATWDDILTPHGWQRVRPFGKGFAWRRPGKNDGISATTGQSADGDRLYVFSTSTCFDTETPYSKFAACTLLEHGGDYSAAARALRAAGYGAPDPIPLHPRTSAATQTRNGPVRLSVVDGTAERAVPPPPSARTVPGTGRPPVTLTDQGNAELLVERHGHRLRYAPSRGAWLRWDSTRWAWCEDDGVAVEAAINTVHAMVPATDAEKKHQHRSLSRRAIEGACALARRDSRIAVPADLLDADPWALNTPDGTIDLRTGGLTAHDPAGLHTKLTGTGYRQDADAPRWLAFLRDTFGGDEQMAGYVQRLAGYSACGIVLHHVLPFLHGPGGNGKSVFLDVLVTVLGDYASTSPAGFLMSGAKEDENAIARLSGLRLVVCSEVNQRARFDEAKLKLLTGGDRLTARFNYQRHFTFVPTHTLWLMGNHQPRVGAGGESFWRRLRLLPFTHVVPPDKQVEGLAEQLVESEGPAILAWIITGAGQALATGLGEPEPVMAATRQYAEEEDALARFMTDRVHLGGGSLVRTDTTDLRQAYESWCRDEGERPVSPQVLGRELRSRHGITQVRSNGRRFYEGLTLLAAANEPDEPDEPHWSQR